MEVACRLVDDLAQLVAGGEVVDGRRTGLCQLSGSGNICERAILVSGNICILTVSSQNVSTGTHTSKIDR